MFTASTVQAGGDRDNAGQCAVPVTLISRENAHTNPPRRRLRSCFRRRGGHFRRRTSLPFALNDNQLRIIMTAAGPLAPEKRAVLMERLAARLQMVRRPNDADLDRAINARADPGAGGLAGASTSTTPTSTARCSPRAPYEREMDAR
jgi:hypothetical protein